MGGKTMARLTGKLLNNQNKDNQNNYNYQNNPNNENNQNKDKLLNLPLNLVLALISGDEIKSRNILSLGQAGQAGQIDIEAQEKKLLELIVLSWENLGDDKAINERIAHLLSEITGRKKVIAYLALTHMTLKLGNKDLARQYINAATLRDDNVNKDLTDLVKLLSFNVDIEIGGCTKVNIDNLIDFKSSNILIQAYANYLIGCLRRYSSFSEKVSQQHLALAIETFTELKIVYLLALSQIELAQCGIDLDQSRRLLANANGVLESLGKRREASYCRLLEHRFTDVIREGFRIGQLVYVSDVMAQLKEEILRASSCDYPVLITGPSGAGKEPIAHAIQQYSDRAKKPFVIVNCRAIAENLIDSEIFGCVKGAFTGADKDKLGYVGASEGGTLFLDEIAELKRDLQAKLFRLIDNLEYNPVGSAITKKANVRIIAATNQRVEELAELDRKGIESPIRHELINRFTLSIKVPALSERREDILPIAQEILRRENASDLSLAKEAKEYLESRMYSSNVRELRDLLRKAITITRQPKQQGSKLISKEMLKGEGEQELANREGFNVFCPTYQYKDAMEFMGRELLVNLLKESGSDTQLAMELSGLPKSTFYRLMKTSGLIK